MSVVGDEAEGMGLGDEVPCEGGKGGECEG